MENELQRALKQALSTTAQEWLDAGSAAPSNNIGLTYAALVRHPDSTAIELKHVLEKQGCVYASTSSVSVHLTQLHKRGMAAREGAYKDTARGPRYVYRYRAIAATYEEAVRIGKESRRNNAVDHPETTFPINKPEVAGGARRKILLRVGGFDAKTQVERMSVIEARAVYAELKAIFG